jgi:hypothetical protein
MSLLGGLLLGVITMSLTLHVPGAPGIGTPTRIGVFVGLALISCLIYATAALWSLAPTDAPARMAPLSASCLWPVLIFAVLFRIVLIPAPAFLSTDWFRYVWDGRVQLAGINPYLYIPVAPELAGLRDDIIFPRINRLEYAPTIYPPIAQMVFYLVATVKQSLPGIKTAMVLFDIITIFVLIRLLMLAGRPPVQVLLYAWHPLPIWEFAGNAHIDAAATCFVALALWAAAGKRSGVAALALAAATLVKFLPVVLLPVIWRKWDWRVPLVFIAVIVAAYLCYIGAGWKVFGFLSGYAAEESGQGGSRLFWLGTLSRLVGPLPAWSGPVYLGLAAVILSGLGAKIAFLENKSVGAALLLSTSLMIVLTPHYPWYFAWLLVPCCLTPCLSVLYLSCAVFLIYSPTYDLNLVWSSLIYIPFCLLALRDLRSHANQSDPRSLQCP